VNLSVTSHNGTVPFPASKRFLPRPTKEKSGDVNAGIAARDCARNASPQSE